MTSQPIPPVIPTNIDPDPADDERTEKVSDEPYAGPDTDLVDGTPVGQADRDEDIRRSGGDPDEA